MRPRKAILILAFLILATTASYGQVQATNGRVVLTPSYGSQCLCAGASIFASSTEIDWMADLGVNGNWWPKNAYDVTLQPGELKVFVVQAWTQGGTSILWLWIPLNAPANITSVTIKKTLRSGAPVVLTEVIPLMVAIAAPHLTTQGLFSDFRNPIGLPFNGSITFPPLTGIGAMAIYGSDFGGIRDWVVRVTGPGVDFELLANVALLSQAHPTLIYFSMPRVAPGSYQFQASALNDPALVSNIITLQVN